MVYLMVMFQFCGRGGDKSRECCVVKGKKKFVLMWC